MRWLNPLSSQAAVALVVTLAGRIAAAPQVAHAGEATDGTVSVDVLATTSVVAHAGAPTNSADGMETSVNVISAASSATYNDGMYTPWSDTTAEESTESAATTQATSTTAVTTSATPTTSSTSVTPTTTTTSTTPSTTSTSSSSSTSISTSSSSSSTSTTTSSTSTSTTSSSSTKSSSSTTSSTSSNTLASAEATNTSENSSSKPKIGVIVPVAISLGVLAILFACLLLFVWRRRVNKRRRLDSRRYDDADYAEKAASLYGGGGDYEHGQEYENAPWTSFGRNSGISEAEGGMAGRGAGNAIYQNVEEQDGNHRGWQWGAAAPAAGDYGSRQARGPLPMTPAQGYSDTMPPSTSQPAQLDAMMAESRRGYEPYQTQPPRRQNSVANAATAIYRSLSGRNKRYGTNTSSVYSQESRSGRGRYNEHGAWEDADEAYQGAADAMPYRNRGLRAGANEKVGADRPLLAADIDGTPRKQGYKPYSPPDTPTRSGAYDPYANSNSGYPSRAPQRNDIPIITTTHADPTDHRGNRARSNSKETEYDSPSVYSPSAFSHSPAASPQMSTYPNALQPGRSTAPGARPVSSAISNHAYTNHLSPQSANDHSSPASPNPLGQSSKSGTTYTLTGMSGVLYDGDTQADSTQPHIPHVNQPLRLSSPVNGQKQVIDISPKKTLRKKNITHRPVTDEPRGESNFSSTDQSPHRAVSAVVRASRARDQSDRSSQNSHESAWDQNVRDQLRTSQGTTGSLDDILKYVLAPSRSPA